MVTRIKLDREYTVQGVVIDRASQAGIQGLRVEAWDRDTRYHDLLGQAQTDVNGAFTIAFDSSYFADDDPNHAPDLFFKVSMDGSEVLNTFDKTQYNVARGLTRVKLEIDLPRAPVAGKDRISTEQAFKAVDWWQASDFGGVYTQARDKGMTMGGLAGALFGDAFKNFDFAPVRPPPAREREIINQSPESARGALATQGVQVTDTRSVSSLDTSGKLKLFTGYPLNLKSGDKVTLYEEDGVVKSYTVDPAPTSSADGQTVARIDGDVQGIKARVAGLDDMRVELANVKAANAEVATRAADDASQVQAQALELARVKAQLEQVQQASVSKDQQIAKLQSDLSQVTKKQDEIAARLPLDRLAVLERQLKTLTAAAPRKPGKSG